MSKNPNKKGLSKGEKFKELETAVENMQMALRLSQMMSQHQGNEIKQMQGDLVYFMGLSNELKYREKATIQINELDEGAIDKLAGELKVKDFNEEAVKRDEIEECEPQDVVDDDSVLIISTTTNDDKDDGIFRSRFHMSECFTPELREALLGKKVGDSFDQTLDEVVHKVNIHDIKRRPPVEINLEDVNPDVGEQATANV